MTTAKQMVKRLQLTPHPEGGYYRETFRDVGDASGRARSTAILFLLAEGQRSHWHRVDAVEVWHYYAGDPLTLLIAPPNGPSAVHTLGPNIFAGHSPQIIVPEGYWQSAQSQGAWTLVGCSVAPGFEFEGFELAPRDFSPDVSQIDTK